MGLRQGALEDMDVTPGFWKDRTVLVTGHTGFKGAWLCLWLESLGARVTGFALPPPTEPSLCDLARLRESIVSVEGDVRDFDAVLAAVSDSAPEIVFHLAAQALVRPSYRDPLTTFSTNVMGTANVLEAVRRDGRVRAVVNVTSDKCYENREWEWGYRETDPMGGHDPYSSSKGCAELIASAFRRSFFSGNGTNGNRPVFLATVRAGNVIGGGDWAEDRLVPDAMRALLDGKPVIVRNPGAVRPWQHVLEPLGGYLLVAERLLAGGRTYAEAWNFGPRSDDARPVRWIMDRLTEAWGPGASWKTENRADGARAPHEANYLKLDCSKASARLGWTPALSLEVALDWVLDWYRRYAAGEDPRAVTLEQIAAYMGRASRES